MFLSKIIGKLIGQIPEGFELRALRVAATALLMILVIVLIPQNPWVWTAPTIILVAALLRDVLRKDFETEHFVGMLFDLLGVLIGTAMAFHLQALIT